VERQTVKNPWARVKRGSPPCVRLSFLGEHFGVSTTGIESMEGQQHIEVDALLDAKEVKRLLRCSLPFVYKLAERGQLSCIRIPCQTLGTRKKELVRFKREDVIGFIESHYTR
jgi:hypothetical protein